MKNKSLFTAFTSKALLIISFITIGFASFTKCNAQSIVGKWKAVSEKRFYTEQGAKMMGKPMEGESEKPGYSSIEYKADHTFIQNFTGLNNSEVTAMKGTWILTGDQLKITLEPQYNPKKIASAYTISINGNTLITTVVTPASSLVIKMITTSTRM